MLNEMEGFLVLVFGFLVFVTITYEEYIILEDTWINEEFLHKDPPVKTGFQIPGLSIS